jgi:Arc-like DNA binding domain
MSIRFSTGSGAVTVPLGYTRTITALQIAPQSAIFEKSSAQGVRSTMKNKVINLNLRLPAQLHGTLVKQARASNRSLNGEIIERLAGSPADSSQEMPWREIPPEVQGFLTLIATVMDVAGHSRFGVDALYAPDTVPAWIDDPSGYAVAAAAATCVLEALHPPQEATADLEYSAALAETNRGHGEAVAKTILDKVAVKASSDRRTASLREALGSLVDRIALPQLVPAARDFEPVWIAPMTSEQRERLEAQHARAKAQPPQKEPKWPHEGDDDTGE